MQKHDFEKGGLIYGKFFPGLKPLAASVKQSGDVAGVSYVYEPGNMTRYEVVFVNTDGGTLMVVANFRRCMFVTGPMFPETSVGYMQEKLGLGAGDCYALIPLINQFFEEQGS